jgi:hypothetical protein
LPLALVAVAGAATFCVALVPLCGNGVPLAVAIAAAVAAVLPLCGKILPPTGANLVGSEA